MSKPTKLTTISLACLLASCASQPTTVPEFTVKPFSEVRHAAGAKPLATGAVATDPYQRGADYQASGELDKALQAYKSAITFDYRHAEARNAMATIYMQRGEPTEAQAILREAIELRPDAAYLRNNLGYIEYLQGNHKAAIAELNAALAVDPNNEWARNNLKLARGALSTPSQAAQPLTAANSLAPKVAAAAPFEIWGEAAQADSMDAPVATASGTIVHALVDEPVVPQSVASDQLVIPNARAYRLEVVNSSGVAGLAKRLSESLTRLGFAVNDITSQRPFDRAITEIQYQEGFETEAKQLAEKLQSPAVLKRLPSAGSDVRVVLGKDLSTRITSIETQIILSNATSATSAVQPVGAPSLTPVSTAPAMTSVEATKSDEEMVSFSLRPYALHVVNANGVRGIARKASDFLRDKGVVAEWVGDERPYRAVTQIVYRDGYLLEAARLRSALPNQPVIVKAEAVIGTADIKLVLGRDLTDKSDMFAQQRGNLLVSAAKTRQPI